MACLISAAKLAASRFTPDWQRLSVLESVFDQLPDALVLWDPEFRITGVNRSAERLFGLSSEEMLGKHCQEVFRSTVDEPGCGVLVGMDKLPTRTHMTVRLKTGNGVDRLAGMRTSKILDGSGLQRSREVTHACFAKLTRIATRRAASNPRQSDCLSFLR